MDVSAINQQVDEGYIARRRHPTAELYIYNYTARTQFDAHWTAETRACRGLILDREGLVVARPFEKFFTLDQHPDPLPVEPFDVFEKLDGSLGILYWMGNTPFIATRGSFDSEQAERANIILHSKYQHLFGILDRSLTYLFEIIYPQNRIVVDYGDTEDLILLTVIETESGRELGPLDAGFPIVRRYDGITDLSALTQLEVLNKEGFVVRFESGVRVKMKFEEYKRLHKLVTGVNARHVWQMLMEGDRLADLVDRVPDEFYTWIRGIESGLRSKFNEIEAICRREFNVLPSRKETALYFQQQSYPRVLFAMLDGKDYAEIIWKMIRPEASASFKCGEE
jgi:RNA ligase